MNEFVWDNDGMIPTGENLSTRKENCSTATLLTSNHAWNDHGSNSDLGVEWPAYNRLIPVTGLLRFIMCHWPLKMHPLDVMSQGLQFTGLLKTSPGNVCNGQTRCAGCSGWTEVLCGKCAALKIILLVLRPSFQFSLWKPQRLGNWLHFLHQMDSIGKGIPALLGL